MEEAAKNNLISEVEAFLKSNKDFREPEGDLNEVSNRFIALSQKPASFSYDTEDPDIFPLSSKTFLSDSVASEWLRGYSPEQL